METLTEILLTNGLAGRVVSSAVVSGLPDGSVGSRWGLGFHGWLQEEPAVVKGCTPFSRKNRFKNIFGEFVYGCMPMRNHLFLLGVQRQRSVQGSILIAGPERGLGDIVFSKRSLCKAT